MFKCSSVILFVDWIIKYHSELSSFCGKKLSHHFELKNCQITISNRKYLIEISLKTIVFDTNNEALNSLNCFTTMMMLCHYYSNLSAPTDVCVCKWRLNCKQNQLMPNSSIFIANERNNKSQVTH